MRKAFIFDFDETLATTKAKVLVRIGYDYDGQIIARLSPAEFNTFKLPKGAQYDFSEFKVGDFIHKADPTFLIHLAKEVFDEGHDVFILTAREHDTSYAIRTFMQKHGVEPTTIHCVGGTNDIAERKRKVLLDYINMYDKVYFYDDSEDNVNIFQHEKLRTYLIET